MLASASGNGKTTFGRALAERLGVPFVELDALNHGPNWTEASPAELRAKVEPVVAQDAWVIDGGYLSKLGDLVLARADTVVWLDQSLPLVLFRLIRRSVRDIVTQRDLFNGNCRTWRVAFFTRDSLVSWAVKTHFRRRRAWPGKFARMPHLELVRLRSPRVVERWLGSR